MVDLASGRGSSLRRAHAHGPDPTGCGLAAARGRSAAADVAEASRSACRGVAPRLCERWRRASRGAVARQSRARRAAGAQGRPDAETWCELLAERAQPSSPTSSACRSSLASSPGRAESSARPARDRRAERSRVEVERGQRLLAPSRGAGLHSVRTSIAAIPLSDPILPRRVGRHRPTHDDPPKRVAADRAIATRSISRERRARLGGRPPGRLASEGVSRVDEPRFLAPGGGYVQQLGGGDRQARGGLRGGPGAPDAARPPRRAGAAAATSGRRRTRRSEPRSTASPPRRLRHSRARSAPSAARPTSSEAGSAHSWPVLTQWPDWTGIGRAPGPTGPGRFRARRRVQALVFGRRAPRPGTSYVRAER